jgi:pilus assembly protein Flp/PilA
MKLMFVVDEGGTTAIEYALIGSLVSIAIIVALATLGTELGFLYELTSAMVGDAI